MIFHNFHNFHKNQKTTDTTTKQRKTMRMPIEEYGTHVFVHTFTCKDDACNVEGCSGMKSLFNHGRTCAKNKTNPIDRCKKCIIFFKIIATHARNCDGTCNIPNCEMIKAHTVTR